MDQILVIQFNNLVRMYTNTVTYSYCDENVKETQHNLNVDFIDKHPEILYLKKGIPRCPYQLEVTFNNNIILVGMF